MHCRLRFENECTQYLEFNAVDAFGPCCPSITKWWEQSSYSVCTFWRDGPTEWTQYAIALEGYGGEWRLDCQRRVCCHCHCHGTRSGIESPSNDNDGNVGVVGSGLTRTFSEYVIAGSGWSGRVRRFGDVSSFEKIRGRRRFTEWDGPRDVVFQRFEPLHFHCVVSKHVFYSFAPIIGEARSLCAVFVVYKNNNNAISVWY